MAKTENSKFAVIKTGGKQYKVAEGDVLMVEKLPAPEKGGLTFSEVLLVNDGKDLKIGTPIIVGTFVKADLVEEGRGEKITVIKFKSKVRHKKTYGHRQPYSKIKITKIS